MAKKNSTPTTVTLTLDDLQAAIDAALEKRLASATKATKAAKATKPVEPQYVQFTKVIRHAAFEAAKAKKNPATGCYLPIKEQTLTVRKAMAAYAAKQGCNPNHWRLHLG